MIKNQKRARAFALGYSAYSQGLSLHRQPYRWHVDLAEEWMRGWRVAELRQNKLGRPVC